MLDQFDPNDIQDIEGARQAIIHQKNRFRYYTLYISRTLWNTWAVACQWGRIGEDPRGGQVRECASKDEALRQAAHAIKLRLKHKYVIKG